MKFGPRKRVAQKELSQVLQRKGYYSKGTILGLAGPEPAAYVNSLIKYNLGDHYELYELDPPVFLKAWNNLKNSSVIKTTKKNITLRVTEGNILTDTIEPRDISGIDFDFCKTLQWKNTELLADKLVDILNNNTLDNIWIRITSSFGPNASLQDLLVRLDTIFKYVEGITKWHRVGYRQKRTYRDTRAMLVWQTRLRRNKMKKRTGKSQRLCELPHEEQQMVRDLISLDYHPSLIGKVFNLSDNSLAAIKAHKTMGNYHEKV